MERVSIILLVTKQSKRQPLSHETHHTAARRRLTRLSAACMQLP